MQRGTPVWIRLIKGAYWDYETVIAAQEDWPLPVFARKWETDANYERMTLFLLEHHERPGGGGYPTAAPARSRAKNPDEFGLCCLSGFSLSWREIRPLERRRLAGSGGGRGKRWDLLQCARRTKWIVG